MCKLCQAKLYVFFIIIVKIDVESVYINVSTYSLHNKGKLIFILLSPIKTFN